MAGLLDSIFKPGEQVDPDLAEKLRKKKEEEDAAAAAAAAKPGPVGGDPSNPNFVPVPDLSPEQEVQQAVNAERNSTPPQATPVPSQTPPLQPPAPMPTPPGVPNGGAPMPGPAPDSVQSILSNPNPQAPAADADPQKMSILDHLFGTGGDQSVDPRTGLTRADRYQQGFGMLGQVGALLMAAGQPISPESRARVLAGFGQLPQQMQQMAQQQLKQRSGAISVQNQVDKQTAVKNFGDQLKQDPSILASLNPAQRALLDSTVQSGDFRTAERLLDPRYRAAAAKAAAPDKGAYNLVNSTPFDPDNIPANFGGTERMNLEALRGVPMDLAMRAARQVRGEEDKATTRNDPKYAATINNLAAQTAGGNGTSYSDRQGFDKSVSSGKHFQTIVSPWAATMNHARTAQEAFDEINNYQGGAWAKLLTTPINTWGKITDGNVQRMIEKYKTAQGNLSKESEKLIAGTGQLTEGARHEIAGTNDPNQTPFQQVGHMQALIEQGDVRMMPLLEQSKRNRHNKNVTMKDIGVPEEAISNKEWLDNRMKNGPGTANPKGSSGGGDVLGQARDAIARGADRNAVISRLKSMGVATEGL
jgi:hypothetical protein